MPTGAPDRPSPDGTLAGAIRGRDICGALTLADAGAAAALIARNRARDAAAPMPRGWPAELLAQIAQTVTVMRTGGQAMDVSSAGGLLPI